MLAAGLTACGGGGGDTSVAVDDTGSVPAPRLRSVSTIKPVDAYVIMGGHIKTCWFNPTKPLLPNHVYRADVAPDGSKVQITVHDRKELGRAGMSTYAIDFKQEGPSTIITYENRKMAPELAAKMAFDIDRWKRGESDCSTVMPKVETTAPPPRDVR